MLCARRRGRVHGRVDTLPGREIWVRRDAGGGRDQDMQLVETFGRTLLFTWRCGLSPDGPG